MVDPIVQQYGQKSKVKEIEQEENDFDRPYDPEEEYDPVMGYGITTSQNTEKTKIDDPALSGFVDDDVAYDPEDETIFEDIQSDTVVTKPHVQTSDSLSCPTPLSIDVVTPATNSTPAQTSTTATLMPNLPTGTVVVSAATLTEQQRMLEELNKQIEEQKQQLKEQEEALRQQREAVGMFMAQFSVSDSLMSPPTKSLPLSQLSSQTTKKNSNSTETVNNSNINSQSVKQEDTTAIPNLKNDTDTVTEQDETQATVRESDNYSSAGEIEDSDVAYDPEDESLFNEIQEDVFQGSSIKTHDLSLSRAGHSVSHKGTSSNSCLSRKRRLSPKRRSHRERDHHRSPSRKSQRRSPSHSRRHRERDRHRRGEKDRLRHRTRDQCERQARHRKEHTSRRHSRGHRRSPSTPRKKHSVSLSPKQHTVPSPQVLENSKHTSVSCNAAAFVGQFIEKNTSSTSVTIKKDPDGYLLKCGVVESPDDSSPFSYELLHNVKLEVSEPLKSPKAQKDSVSERNDKGSTSFTEQDKPFDQQTLLDKIETTVPLRVSDPPIRDSPESPDPEPQFLKPSGTEKSESIKTEENRNPDIDTSVLVPVKNTCLAIGGQEAVSNIPMSTVVSPISDVTNLSFRALELPGQGDQGMIEANIQTERETSSLKHTQMMGQEGSHSHSDTGSDIQGSRLEIDPVTKCHGPGVSGTSIRDPGPEMEEPGRRASVTGIKFPEPDKSSAVMQAMSPNIWGHGTHRHNPATVMQSSEANTIETSLQYLKTDGIGSGPATIGSGIRILNMERASMQAMNPKGHGPDVINIAQEIKGHKSVTNITDLQLGNSRSAVIEVVGAQCFVGPQVGDRVPDIIGRGRGQHNRGGRPHTRGMRSSMRGGGIRGPSPGPSFGGSGRVLEKRGSQERGFQPHGRKADFIRVDGGPQRGRDVPIRGTRQNISYESVHPNMPCIEQDNSVPGVHFKEPQTDTRAERGRDVGETGPESDIDMQWRNIQSPELEWRNEQMGQEHRGSMSSIKNVDWRGPEAGGIVHNMGDQMSQNKGLDSHIKGLDWSGPGSDWRGTNRRESGPIRGKQFIQNQWAPGPDMDVPLHDRRAPGGQDFRRPEHERKCPAIDSLGPGMRGPGVDHTGGGMEGPGTGRRAPGGPYFTGPGLEMKGPGMESQGQDRRGPPGPDFRGTWPERRGPAVGTRSEMQGLEGLEFKGPECARRESNMEVPGIKRKGPGGPDFRGPGPESRGLSMDCRGTDRGGPGHPDFTRPRPERCASIESPGTEGRGLAGPNFRGQRLDNRGLSLEGPGPDSRGHGGPAFTGQAPDRRRPATGAVGPDRRRPEGSDFTGPAPDRRGPAMGATGPDRRRPEGSDFTGPGPDRRGPAMDNLGKDWRESGVADFRGPGHERRALSMGNQDSYKIGLGGPEFRGGLAIDRSGPDRRGPGVSDLIGPGCERRGPSIECHGPKRIGPGDNNSGVLGPDKRGPYMGDSGPECIGIWSERTGPCIESTGPHSRGQLGLHLGGPGPEGGHPGMEGPGPGGRGSDIRGPWLQGAGRGCKRVGPNRRGPRGPNFMGHMAERKPPDMEETENNSSFPRDSQFRDPDQERRSSDMMDSELNRRTPVFRQVECEITITEGQEKGPRGPDFRVPDTVGSGPDRQEPGGSDFREVQPERRGSYMEVSGPDWRGSGCSDFRDTGTRKKSQNIKRPRHDSRDDWGGSDFRESESMQGIPNIEGPGPDRTGPPLRVPRPMRRNIRGRGTDKMTLNHGDRWKSTDTEGQWSDRRPNMKAVVNETESSEDNWKRHGNSDPDEQGQDHSRQGPHGEWTGRWGAGPIQERPNMPFPGPMRGPQGDWSGPGCREPGPVHDNSDMVCQGPSREGAGNEWKQPERGVSGPNRRGPGPFFRGDRDPDNEGQPHDRNQLDIRESDVGNDFRGNMRGPNIEGPRAHRGGPDLISLCPNERGFEMEGVNKIYPRGQDLQYLGPGNRNSVTEGPVTGGRFSDCGGLGSERHAEHTFIKENRGIDLRRPGPGKSSDIRHGPDRWDTNAEVSQFDIRGPAMIGPGLDSRPSEPPTKSDMRQRKPGQRGQTASNERRGPALRHFGKSETRHLNNPHHHPHSAPFNRPPAPAPNSGRKTCPGFDNQQNQQAGKPQRHRAALLPTPTEGLIRFPKQP